MDLKEIDNNITITHWYYKSKFSAVLKILNKYIDWKNNTSKIYCIADIGSGSGIFIKEFNKRINISRKSIYAVDIGYDNSKLGLFEDIHWTRKLPIDALPDLLFFMDILEHIDNDVEFLSKYVELSKNGSKFLITVPAFQFLWSEHDEFLDHKRRYNLKQLEKVIQESGLHIIKSRYIYGLLLPAAVISRKIVDPLSTFMGRKKKQGIHPVNSFLNYLLTKVFSLEVALIRNNRLFGLTCVVLAEKK